MLYCAECVVKNCAKRVGEELGYPKGCPSVFPKQEQYLAEYQDPTDALIARITAECGPVYSEGRVEKTIRFAKMCGYRKIGVAFCITLAKEAEIFSQLLKEASFTVESILCKVGHQNRASIGYSGNDMPMCNPIAQAELLNEAETELNVLIGLCVGHDAIFIRHSQAPVTVLVAKDHLYCNDPSAYFRDLRQKG